MRRMLALLLLLAAGVVRASVPEPGGQAGAPWWERSIWDDPARQYQWYPRDPPPKREEKKPEAGKKEAGPRPDIRRMKTVKEVREELERLKGIAIMAPTPENVRAYLEANKYVMDKSAVFADVARRVIWATPEIDYAQRRPTVTAGAHLMQDLKQTTLAATVKEVMQSHGVFFFLRSDCPYCHKQAGILKYLEQFYGLQVFPVSLDGGGVPEYPQPRPDNGIARALGVSTVPALFLMPRSPAPGAAPVPIGYGLLSGEEIVERIHALTRTRPGDEF